MARAPKPKADLVSRPPHYQGNGLESIEVIEAFGLDFFEGNILKYLLRWRRKGGVDDLRKARWYLDRLIGNQEGGAERRGG